LAMIPSYNEERLIRRGAALTDKTLFTICIIRG
jgi:hypothetical protein